MDKKNLKVIIKIAILITALILVPINSKFVYLLGVELVAVLILTDKNNLKKLEMIIDVAIFITALILVPINSKFIYLLGLELFIILLLTKRKKE